NYSDIPQYVNEFHVKELYEKEFLALLKKYFTHVRFLYQKVNYASIVSPKEPPVGFKEIWGDYSRISTADRLQQAVYNLIVASDRKVPVMYASIFNGKKVLMDMNAKHTYQLKEKDDRILQQQSLVEEGAKAVRRLTTHIARKDNLLRQRQDQISQITNEINALRKEIAERENEITMLGEQAREKSRQIDELTSRLEERRRNVELLAGRLTEAEEKIGDLEKTQRETQQAANELADRNKAIMQQMANEHADRERTIVQQAANEIADRERRIRELMESTSWRITAPIRLGKRVMRVVKRELAAAFKQSAGIAARVLRAIVWTPPVKKLTKTIVYHVMGNYFKTTQGYKHYFLEKEKRRSALLNTKPHWKTMSEENILSAFEPNPIPAPTDGHVAVSVIIPVCGHFTYYYSALQSIKNNTMGSDYEVILVDDMAPAETKTALSRMRGVRVIENSRKLGFWGSCDNGARSAKGDYLVLLREDTLVMPGWMSSLRGTFVMRPEAGLVGAKVIYPDNSIKEAGGIVWRDGTYHHYGLYKNQYDPECNYLREVDFCSNVCLMFTRRSYDLLQTSDDYGRLSEYMSIDVALQIEAAGLKV
ncbi:MAG TPA: glycosyltransferase, partial [Spirochaetia bacterium]|nr:glycosyltransferase [Spirochaetia bacterium]